MKIQATAYLRLPFEFELSRLQQDYRRLSQLQWQAHYNQQAHQGDWTCLPLRAAGGRDYDIYADNGESYQDTQWLKLCPYFCEVLQQFACEKIAVRLMSLAAGARILPHRDPGGGFEDGVARLHIPIITDPRIHFILDGEAVHFSAAQCWYMNANCLHAVENPSDVERIHLVIDCIPNAWLRTVFTNAGWRENPASYFGDSNISEQNLTEVIAALRAQGNNAANILAQELLTKSLRSQTE